MRLLVKQLNITLSTDSISKAIKELKAYKAEINKKSELLVQTLTDLGVNIARAKVLEMNINDTGNLMSTIGGYYSPNLNAGFVTVSCEYAIFIEFGTGIVGKQNPYPGDAMAKTGYKYGGGSHYVVTKDGRIGWFYPADDGTWRFTEGLPSRPFMYETALELENKFSNIVRSVFK